MRRRVTVHVETELEASAEAVWEAMRRLSTFLYVCRGLLSVPSMRGQEQLAEPGAGGTGWVFLFHVLPLHRHTIDIVEADPERCTIRTHEHGGMVKAWDHTLRVVPLGDARSRYSDTVEIEAGVATPLVVAFAHVAYRYRQRRWRRLARTLAAGTRGERTVS